jgi:uncharacterized protein (DUF849 family)
VVLNSFYAVLKYPKYLAKQECFRLLFGSQRHLYLITIKKKDKSKIYFLCGDKESDDMVSDLNKMEYLQQMLLFELEPEKIVKTVNTMKIMARWICSSYFMAWLLMTST